MYKHNHHAHIINALSCINGSLLCSSEAGFGGGTAISLLLGEFRLSTDIDFLCSSPDGYKKLRELFFDPVSRTTLLGGLTVMREFSLGRDAIRGVVSADGQHPIKIEFVNEGRIILSPFEYSLTSNPLLSKVPVLCLTDLFAEKIMANDDRGLDKNYTSRDMIDLCFLVEHFGCVPDDAVKKVDKAYGISDSFLRRFEKIKDTLRDPVYLDSCMTKMHIDHEYKDFILAGLDRLDIQKPKRDICVPKV